MRVHHTGEPDVSFDSGDLDWGNGLPLLVRQHLDPLPPGALLEFRARCCAGGESGYSVASVRRRSRWYCDSLLFASVIVPSWSATRPTSLPGITT